MSTYEQMIDENNNSILRFIGYHVLVITGVQSGIWWLVADTQHEQNCRTLFISAQPTNKMAVHCMLSQGHLHARVSPQFVPAYYLLFFHNKTNTTYTHFCSHKQQRHQHNYALSGRVVTMATTHKIRTSCSNGQCQNYIYLTELSRENRCNEIIDL